MTAASETKSGRRGSERLLWDCATIDRVIEHTLPPATERLTSIVGKELAQFLLHQPPTAVSHHHAV